MKKFVCSVCGYVHTAEELAADFKCPVCRVPASKFVEQKGEMKLAAEHEYGATQGKCDLAACAKKNGLDAIHDTVHEMARDEARHGKALKGLLERYFG